MTRDPALGALLRLYRRHAGLTQRDLAALSGVSEREISDLERNVRQIPRAHTLAALATALHLSHAKHARLVRAATRAPQRPAAAERPAGAGGGTAPASDPAASAYDLTARLLPLIDQALQRALAPLAASLAQQSTTLDRLTLAIATLRAALPPPTAPEPAQHMPPPPPHPLAASQDPHNDPVDPVAIQHQDRRLADRRTHAAPWTAPDRRLAARDRRAPQDRDHFEDSIMAQYVPPRPTIVPFTEDV